jgi:tetratricopeptide (TPR) repeat protein
MGTKPNPDETFITTGAGVVVLIGVGRVGGDAFKGNRLDVIEIAHDFFHGLRSHGVTLVQIEGLLEDARCSFDAALRRVPAYAAARGHLAEVEAQLGEIDSAMSRLYSLARSSDDPDYAGQLARILAEAGRYGESRRWRRLAAARFDELVANRPEAFADHADEFWLAAGADPDKALRFAKMNAQVRNTPRARDLLAQAVAASRPGRRVAVPVLTNGVRP